jgi:hypothetical protein
LKATKVLVRYYDDKVRSDEAAVPSNEETTLCNAIEKAFSCLKGKHATTKARKLMEALLNGDLLKGEVAIAF